MKKVKLIQMETVCTPNGTTLLYSCIMYRHHHKTTLGQQSYKLNALTLVGIKPTTFESLSQSLARSPILCLFLRSFEGDLLISLSVEQIIIKPLKEYQDDGHQ